MKYHVKCKMHFSHISTQRNVDHVRSDSDQDQIMSDASDQIYSYSSSSDRIKAKVRLDDATLLCGGDQTVHGASNQTGTCSAKRILSTTLSDSQSQYS